MKKPAVFLLIVLCLAVAFPFFSAGAQSGLYFTVVNDTLQDFNDQTMPVKINDVYYLPLSVFNQNSLSTYTKYNNRVATIFSYSDDRSLSFEFGSGNTYDNKGKAYPFTAIYYNSGVYVPAVRTCQFFGFRFSVYTMENSEFLRIKNSNYTLSDDDFARLGALQMQSRLNEYAESHQQPSPSTSPKPSTPTPTPTETNEPGNKYASVYLSVRGIGSSTSSMLNSLDFYGYSACFFVTAEEIKENPDLIRRIAGSGHSVGILCSQNLSEDYAKASSLLREAANLKTILVALDCEYNQELASTAQSLGLIVWCDSSMPVFGFNSNVSSTVVYNIIDRASGRLDLAFSSSSVSLFRGALSDIFDNNYSVRTINETTNTYISLS